MERAMAAEEDRTRLIGEIACILRDTSVPAEARAAGLTFIGYLARRMPGEAASRDGVDEMCRRASRQGAELSALRGRRTR